MAEALPFQIDNFWSNRNTKKVLKHSDFNVSLFVPD